MPAAALDLPAGPIHRVAHRFAGRSRSDMGDSCVELPFRRGTWAFWRYVARFNRRQLPRIGQRLADLAADRTIRLRTNSESDVLVAHFAAVR